MSDFFIKYKNIAIHAEDSKKLSGLRTPRCKVIVMQKEDDFELFRVQNPYAQCKKIDLAEQLYGKNLKYTLPKYIREAVLELPEVKSLLRDDKIDIILNDNL